MFVLQDDGATFPCATPSSNIENRPLLSVFVFKGALDREPRLADSSDS